MTNWMLCRTHEQREQIIDGTKTQHRFMLSDRNWWLDGNELWHEYRSNRQVLIGIGWEYPIRIGSPELGRIRIIAIRREQLQDMTSQDAVAEGIARVPYAYGMRSDVADLWNSFHTKPGTFWEDNPWTCVLAFELVKSRYMGQAYD